MGQFMNDDVFEAFDELLREFGIESNAFRERSVITIFLWPGDELRWW